MSAWIAFNRTTDSNKIEVIVLDDQKSRELRRIQTTGLAVYLDQTRVMSFFLFLSYLFLISPYPHSRVYLRYRTIVQLNSQIRRLNSSQFS